MFIPSPIDTLTAENCEKPPPANAITLFKDSWSKPVRKNPLVELMLEEIASWRDISEAENPESMPGRLVHHLKEAVAIIEALTPKADDPLPYWLTGSR